MIVFKNKRTAFTIAESTVKVLGALVNTGRNEQRNVAFVTEFTFEKPHSAATEAAPTVFG